MLKLTIPCAKATANLVMALASYQEARSPVELSLSPVYHYQYSSIAKVLDHIAPNEAIHLAVQKSIQGMCMPYFERSISQQYFLLQTDTTPVCKPHSPTLRDRIYVAVPNNVIPGNKPLNIGYELSFVNISDPETAWSLPLNMKRVGVDQTASECALEQLKALFAHPQLDFSDERLINTLDSKYGNAHYLAPAHQYENLVNVVRLRAGMKVWKYQPRPSGGAPAVYGEKYYLNSQSGYQTYKHPKSKQPCEVFQRAIFELEADETQHLEAQTRKGRKLIITVKRYNDMMIRSKNGHNMKDKPFDLLAVQVCDKESEEPIFDREMFIAICGEHKGEISTSMGYEFYRHRYDIEPYIRFAKQRLMLEDFQTPEIKHFDNWLLMLHLASWLLYAASTEAYFCPRKWEQYLPKNKEASSAARLSITQTRKAAQRLFLTFDQGPFKPKKYKKGNGREKGMTFTPRTRYKVVKKTTNKAKLKGKIEQVE
jgi:hypothetical protein